MRPGATVDDVSDAEIWAAVDNAIISDGYDEYVRLAAVTDVARALRQEAEAPNPPNRTDLPLSF